MAHTNIYQTYTYVYIQYIYVCICMYVRVSMYVCMGVWCHLVLVIDVERCSVSQLINWKLLWVPKVAVNESSTMNKTFLFYDYAYLNIRKVLNRFYQALFSGDLRRFLNTLSLRSLSLNIYTINTKKYKNHNKKYI